VEVAAGFTTHSGWAVAVVTGLVDGHIRVYDRRRVELVSSDLPRQAYHEAADLPADEARQLVAAVDASIAGCSSSALSAIRAAVSDHALVAVGVVGPTRAIPDVATVLASHALMHASEGEQYRQGVSAAAEQLGLPVWRTEPRQLTTDVVQALGWSESRLADEHKQIRTTMGPPWQKDHKQAAEIGIIALRSVR
jgi:hypothetical protein